MKGALRYAKGIGTSVTIALLAFGARYGQNWLFRSVEDPAPAAAIIVQDQFTSRSSVSPQRIVESPEFARWKIAVVTNRPDVVPDESGLHRISHSSAPKTLAEQVIDASFSVPQSVFGSIDVTVPLIRRRGVCDLTSDADAPVCPEPMQTVARTDFHANLHDLVARSQARDIVVFVHGFNVSLEQAAARAAQIAEDMPFHGVMVAFSWHSAARTEAYLTDEALAERYFWNLAQFIADLRRDLEDDVRIHLLAHSMGNRVALRALNALAGAINPNGQPADLFAAASLSGRGFQSPTDSGFRSVISLSPRQLQERFPDWGAWRKGQLGSPPIATLILAAPDVDVSEFRTFVENIRHISRRMVLYASDTDYALEASRRVHGGKWRAGDSRAKLQVAGLQTVRVTGVDSIDPLGHSYYGSNAKVLTQLAMLLRPPVDLHRPIGAVGWNRNETTALSGSPGRQ